MNKNLTASAITWFFQRKLQILALLIAACPSIAQAGYQEAHARLLCTENAAIVQFVNSQNGAPPNYPNLPETFAEQFETATEFPEFECNLGGPSSQRMLRLKIGNDQMVPWGDCGAGLRAFFSLWIGGHKVFSKKYFHIGCHWGQFDNVDAVFFYGRNTLLCTYPNTNGKWRTEHPIPENLACVDVSQVHSNTAIDEIEYPADGSKRREGHIELLSSSDNTLCGLFEGAANNSQHPVKFFDELIAAKKPTSYNRRSPEYGQFFPLVADINNDGSMDMIAIQPRGRLDHYVSMLINGAHTPITTDSDIPPTSSSIPLFLGGPSDVSDNAYELSIFKWRDKTYVYMYGLFLGRSPDRMVMQMQPDGTADTICELDRIEINF